MDNIELFDEEIDTIREYAELDMESFQEVLKCTRSTLKNIGNSISPAMVVDIIEEATCNLVYCSDEPLTVEQAVEYAVSGLRLSDEMNNMFDDDDLDNGHVNKMMS